MRPAETRSQWLKDVLMAEPAGEEVELREHVRADVCIVGGGFTGLWTALRLKEMEPTLEVVLVEADICGGGASGRNGGMMLSWAAKFQTLEKMCGTDEALRLVRASDAAVDQIGVFCSSNGIDARYRKEGWLWTASNQAQVGSWQTCMDALGKHGLTPFAVLTPEDVVQLSGSTRHVAGVYASQAATVDPGRLVRGLTLAARKTGVRIFERSPMVALERLAAPRVRTPLGSVTAGSVVLALNAWSARLPELRRAIIIVGSDMVATEPCGDLLAELGLANGIGISDSRLFVHYYQITKDGRLAFGKGGGTFAFGGAFRDEFEGESRYADDVRAAIDAFYPRLRQVRTAKTWAGPIDRTLTGIPCFGKLGGRSDIVFGFGYSGNGVGPTYVGARILASLALRRRDEWSETPLAAGVRGTFPAEPFRFLGSKAIRSAIARKEAAEDRGQRPKPIDTLLAGLAPGGLVPISSRKPSPVS